MGHFGFSCVGLIYLLMLFIPNGMWAKKQPEGYDPSGENKVLLVFERAGQVLTTACALLFSDYNLRTFTPWNLWLVASFALMVIYELFWVRYFRNPTRESFYRPFLGVPVPGASLPISTVVLGIGHNEIHLGYVKKLKNERKSS